MSATIFPLVLIAAVVVTAAATAFFLRGAGGDKNDATARFELLLERAKNDLTATQRELVESSRTEFLALAGQRLDTTQAGIAAKLTELVAPVGEKLTQVDAFVRELEQKRTEAYTELRAQVATLTANGSDLRNVATALADKTTQLATALRNPQMRGRWGEIQLKKVCELAGMLEHCDFDEQEFFRDLDRSMRPDMTIKIPNDRYIFVDAKVPLDAYLNAVEEKDETRRSAFLEDYGKALKSRVNALASVKYQNIDGSADFVVMFVPGESFLAAAFAKSPDLVEYAAARSIFIVGPLTLMTLLRSYGMVWQNVKQEERAKEIADTAAEFYKRFLVFAGHLKKLGNNLDAIVRVFNDAIGSYERNVIPKGREMADLAALSNVNDGGEVPPITTAARKIASKTAVAAIESISATTDDDEAETEEVTL